MVIKHFYFLYLYIKLFQNYFIITNYVLMLSSLIIYHIMVHILEQKILFIQELLFKDFINQQDYLYLFLDCSYHNIYLNFYFYIQFNFQVNSSFLLFFITFLFYLLYFMYNIFISLFPVFNFLISIHYIFQCHVQFYSIQFNLIIIFCVHLLICVYYFIILHIFNFVFQLIIYMVSLLTHFIIIILFILNHHKSSYNKYLIY